MIPGKEEYAAVAESAMRSGSLDRFIVTNTEDRRAFQKIREQARCKVCFLAIICVGFHVLGQLSSP
jgi:hypothetical protein